jgi:hypothetical protein
MDKRQPSPEMAATLSSLISGFMVSQAIHAVAKLGVADALTDGPRDIEDLAESCGASVDGLYRTLRCLAALGLFDECGERTFALTSMGSLLCQDAPGSLRPWALLSGESWAREPWGEILHSIQTGRPAFDAVHGTDAYSFLTQSPPAAQLFHAAMISSAGQLLAPAIDSYDFSGIDHLIDVGGGHGALLSRVLDAYPTMQGTLVDLPQTVEDARTFLDGQGQGVGGRCKVIAGDFFQTVPPSGDAYALRWILHNWDDTHAVAILGNCRRAMPSHARVLIFERIVPTGNAPADSKVLDLNMMIMQGGRERTEAEFTMLLGRAGLELVGIHRNALPLCIFEARAAGF